MARNSIKLSPLMIAAVTCPDPQSPINGYIEVSEYTGEYVFGSVAMYHCNPGYRLADTGHTELMVCGESGEWGPETRRDPGSGVRVTHQGSDVTSPRGPHICEPVTCEQPPRVEHAVLELLNSSTGLGSLLVYSCEAGFYDQQQGDSVTVSQCQANSIWSPVTLR